MIYIKNLYRFAVQNYKFILQMKKLFLVVAMVAIGFGSAFAQSPIRVGGTLAYGTEDLNLGFGVNGVYTLNENIDIAASFTHFLGKSETIPGVSMLGISTPETKISSNASILDLDGRYNFTEVADFKIYGAAGVALTFGSAEINNVKSTDTSVGFNLGAGASYSLTDNLVLNPELKYTIGDGSFFRAGISVQYNF